MAILHQFTQDLRFALRQLRRAPAFALTAVLTLALGIGATTAVFSLLDQALLRSLPVRDPSSLVILEGTGSVWEGHASSYGGDPEAYFSVPMFHDLQRENHAFQGLLASTKASVDLTLNHTSTEVPAELVSGNYFSLLGVEPALGRLFTPSDDTTPNSNPVAVLSFNFWRDHLGANPTLVGSTVSINGHPFQILGVAAPRFRSAIWGEAPALFLPLSMIAEAIPVRDPSKPDGRLTDHTDKWINIIGRLEPGISLAGAEAAMNPLWHALRAAELQALGHRSAYFTDDFLTHSRMVLKPGARGFSYQRDSFQTPLLASMAMALLILLLSSVNVASLLLVRSTQRLREFSVRYALGAATSRILRQILLEGLLLGGFGGLLGILVAPLTTRLLLSLFAAGDNSSIPFATAPDLRLLLFSFGVALAVSLAFSLAPMLQLRQADLSDTLHRTALSSTGTRPRLRRFAVSLQIALSSVLLVGAGLFVQTMHNLRSADVGFNPSHLVTFGIAPKLAGYAPSAIPALHQHVLETLGSLPGIESVAGSSLAVLAGDGHGGTISVAGFVPPPDDEFDTEEQAVSPNYFQTLEIPLLTGRIFTTDDRPSTQQVAIVNQAFVQHFCAGNIPSCLGRQIGENGGVHAPLDTTVVGIVRDAKHLDLRSAPRPTVFRPLTQQPNASELHLYLRSARPPAQMLPTIRRSMQALNPALALTDLRTVDDQIDDMLSTERLISVISTSFGCLAALLAGVGLYGLLAFSTAQRTREIGIRIALGSSRSAVVRIVFAEVLTLASLGFLVAIPAALALAHLVRSELFGISPADPRAILAATLTMLLVAFVAALLPARRAASVDPNVALRTE